MTDEAQYSEVQYASIEDITRKRFNEGEDYDLPGVGKIRIRALTRQEFIQANTRFGDDMAKQEQFILSRCVLKPEGVTEAVVVRWQAASNASEINKLSMHINEISGLGKGADKSGMD